MRVFIADDNAGFAEFCARVARAEGWTVTLCRDGAELLEAVAEDEAPALVLCDVNMPRHDGFDVIKGLAGGSRRLALRFMTGGAPVNVQAAALLGRERGLLLRAPLFKPVAIEALRAALAEDLEFLSSL